MSNYTYKTKGTCSSEIQFDLNDGIVSNVIFTKGCAGNTSGIAKLTEGMNAKEIISRLDGINCANRGTSCPDQLAKAIKQAL